MGLEIIRGTGLENSDELPIETWKDLEEGAPSKWMILKDVSFILLVALVCMKNIFTTCCIFFRILYVIARYI